MNIRPNKVERNRTICCVHRLIYNELVKRDPNDPLIPLVQEVFDYGKKMSNKLRQYCHKYDDGWWQKNKLSGGEITDPDTVKPND